MTEGGRQTDRQRERGLKKARGEIKMRRNAESSIKKRRKLAIIEI